MRRMQYSLITLMLAAVSLTVGCQTVDTELAMLFGEAPPSQATEQTPPADESPKYYVEVREDGRTPKLMQFPLSDTIYVQQALEQSGAAKRFRRMKVELYRKLPNGGGHRLDVKFDPSTHRVPVGEDYALHPNDRLVVTEDTSTILDDMLGTLTEPLGKAAGK